MRARAWCLWTLSAFLLAGCVTPARLHEEGRGAESGALARFPLSGEYDATFVTPWVGRLRGRVHAEVTERGFKANTPPGVAWNLVGGLESVLGRVFTPFLFPSGMILTWETTLPNKDGPGIGTIGVGSMSSLRMATRIESLDGTAKILLRDGRAIGAMEFRRASGERATGVDYPGLVSAAQERIDRSLYDARVASSGAVRTYMNDVRSAAGVARDDVEFLFAAGAAARKSLKFNAPLFFPAPGEEELAREELVSLVRPARATYDEDARIATLRIDAFVDEGDLKGALSEAVGHAPAGIVVDLRTSGGVDALALVVASRLLVRDVELGVLCSRGGRERALRGEEFPSVEIQNGEDVDRLLAVIDEHGGARVVVRAAPDAYTGPLAVAVSGRTTSTSEWFAWVMKASGRAKVYGQTTAGRPLLTREFDLGQGWRLRLAAVDWLPAVGPKVFGKGVSPDVRAGREEAAEVAKRSLAREAQPGRARPDEEPARGEFPEFSRR